MQKLLLAPFLLTSLFSFGGELKANPNSRYELPDPRSSFSENQSNSKDVWYLLNQTAEEGRNVQRGWDRKWAPLGFEKLKITTVSNRTICERLASKEKNWIEQIDLGKGGIKEKRYKANTKCIEGRNENNAKYVLRIASTKMLTAMNYPKKYLARNNYSSFDTLYFKNLSKCNLVKSQLDNWFTRLENKFFNKEVMGDYNFFVRYSTKCFSKN